MHVHVHEAQLSRATAQGCIYFYSTSAAFNTFPMLHFYLKENGNKSFIVSLERDSKTI